MAEQGMMTGKPLIESDRVDASRDRNWDWSDRSREEELHDHYRAPYYWDE